MKNKHTEIITIASIALICSALYISLCFNTNIWMDEAFTATLVHNTFSGVLYSSMQDTLPPLYNLLLKLTTTILGYNIYVMKLTSVVPMILTIIIAATTVRKRFGAITSIAFMLCLTGMPLMLYFGVEIRMYSLGFFFATASGIYAYEVICDSCRKNWILFTVLSVLAGYSHHFAFVTVGFVYLFLLVYYFFADFKHIARWFKFLGFTFLLYFPCMLVTLRQFGNVSGYFSMPDITLQMFVQYLLYPYMVSKITGSILCILIMAILIIFCAYKLFTRKEFTNDNLYSVACLAVYPGVLVFGTIVSKIMTANIFVDRYLFFSVGLLWLFVAIQIGKLPKKFTYIAFATLIYIGICYYSVELDVEYHNSADEEIEFLRDNIKPGDILYPIGGHEELECCIPFLSIIANENAPLTYVAPLSTALDAIEMYKDAGMTLWIAVLDGYDFSEEDLSLLNNSGYIAVDAAHFDFDRYACTMYKIIKQ